jgi:hypothetical protein
MEVGVSCGEWPDLRFARDAYINMVIVCIDDEASAARSACCLCFLINGDDISKKLLM